MAEIINLRQARKKKARTEKEVRASENRILFGRTKAEKELTEAERSLSQRRLDAHKRDEEKP